MPFGTPPPSKSLLVGNKHVSPIVPQSVSFVHVCPICDVDTAVPPAAPPVAPAPVPLVPVTGVPPFPSRPPSVNSFPAGVPLSDPQAGINPTKAAENTPTEVTIDSRVFTLN